MARDLSVNRLEQKFDMPYPGRALNEPGREIDPAIRSLVRDMRAYDEASRHHKLIEEAQAKAQKIADYGYSLDRAVRDWRNHAHYVDHALKRVYLAPEEARARLAELELARGQDAVTRALGERPEQFGRLRTVEERGLLGLTRHNDAPARTDARRLGLTLNEYRQAEQALRPLLADSRGALTEDPLSAAEHAAAVARERSQAHVRELQEAGRSLPDRRVLQRTTGELTATLSPPEMRLLRTFVTDAQARLAVKFREIGHELER